MISRRKQLAILALFAGTIIIMLAGAFSNAMLAEKGLQPVYWPRISPFLESKPDPVFISARLSHYWPAWGGPNCFRFVNGQCLSPTASGSPWQEWINTGLACPAEYEFGTVFVLPGGEEFTCVDRGGKVQMVGGIPWLDLLVESPPVPYGTIIIVEVRE